MRAGSAALLIVLAAAVGSFAQAAPDAGAARLLAGSWLLGTVPDKGSCLSHWYPGTEIEFEFARTGGRALIFEHYDLFTALQLGGVVAAGRGFDVSVRLPDGKIKPWVHIEQLAPGKVELSYPGSAPQKSVIAYRCGDVVTGVDDDVPFDMLAKLTPATSGSAAFVQVQPGISDRDVCEHPERLDAGKSLSLNFLQFELLGPVHYYVFGYSFRPKRNPEFDIVRHVRMIDDHTLQLEMQTHATGEGGFEVPESRGEHYTLTVIDRGTRFEIPELGTAFVHCPPGK